MAKSDVKIDSGLLKRLIFIYGDKGGVGKSALARLVLDIYRSLSHPCKAIDSDTSNSDLYRCYRRVGDGLRQLADDEPDAVERVDFTNRGEADYLIDSLGDYQETILVDLPARSRAALDISKIVTFYGKRILEIFFTQKYEQHTESY